MTEKCKQCSCLDQWSHWCYAFNCIRNPNDSSCYGFIPRKTNIDKGSESNGKIHGKSNA